MKMVIYILILIGILGIVGFIFVSSRLEVIQIDKNKLGTISNRNLESVSDTELYLKSLGTDTKELTEEELKSLLEEHKEAIAIETRDDRIIIQDAYIGHAGKTWEINTIVQDELNISLIQISDNEFALYPYSIDSKITEEVDYTWKTVLNISGQALILKQDETASELSKPIFFSIPNDVNYFEIEIGKSSTLINVTGTAATQHALQDKFVINSTGGFLVVFGGVGNDLVFADSWNYGKNWRSKIIYTGTASRVGLLQTPNGTLMAYFVESGDIFATFSNDGGATWNTAAAIADGGLTGLTNPSCASDSNNNIHCAMIYGLAGLATSRYINNSNWGVPTDLIIINDDLLNSTNEVDLEVDSTNQPWVVGIGTDEDCIDLWSPSSRGWGTLNKTNVFCSTSYVEGRAADISIRGVGNEERIYIITTVRGGVYVLNSTLSNNQTWQIKTLQTTGTFSEPSSAMTYWGKFEGLYSNSTVSSVINGLLSTNSSNMSVFTLNKSREGNQGGPNFGSVQDSHYPIANRLNQTNGTVHYIFTNQTGDVLYSNYLFPVEIVNASADSCTYSSGNWNVDCADNCVISANTNLLDNNIYITGTGTFTINDAVKVFNYGYLKTDKTCYVRASGTGGFYYNG